MLATSDVDPATDDVAEMEDGGDDGGGGDDV